VIYFFRRETDLRMCETRLQPDGPGYELVVTDGPCSYVERFMELSALLAREHALMLAWYAQGWRTPDTPRRRARA
jgi:hypothetical protein